MTDYQFKQIIVMIYKLLEANVEAGRNPQELLDAVAQLIGDPKTEILNPCPCLTKLTCKWGVNRDANH
ncbi:MAG: hypothetical protein LBO82_05300 [Synergistaceae bacterium]|nr:hypothetical protein [Synergistaceae bacterium]